jgi:hypothetical protein
MSAATLAARVAADLDIFPALRTKTTSWDQKKGSESTFAQDCAVAAL